MKKLFSAIIICVIALSCNQSEGVKLGTLQKVSHKSFPCNFYVAEFAFEGGRAVSSSNGKSSSYQNTQEVKIDKAAFDSLGNYVGFPFRFEYKDDGFEICGTSKELTSLVLMVR